MLDGVSAVGGSALWGTIIHLGFFTIAVLVPAAILLAIADEIWHEVVAPILTPFWLIMNSLVRAITHNQHCDCDDCRQKQYDKLYENTMERLRAERRGVRI